MEKRKKEETDPIKASYDKIVMLMNEKRNDLKKQEEEIFERKKEVKKQEEKLVERKKAMEDLESQVNTLKKTSSQQVTLNIGGQLFTTSITTLINKSSMLSLMFSARFSMEPNSSGHYFIDRDSKHFRTILNQRNLFGSNEIYLKGHSKVDLGELKIELQFYQIDGLMELVFPYTITSSNITWDITFNSPPFTISSNKLTATKASLGNYSSNICLEQIWNEICKVYFFSVKITSITNNMLIGVANKSVLDKTGYVGKKNKGWGFILRMVYLITIINIK